MTVKVLYFASLRDAAGVAEEVVHSGAVDAGALYAELQALHGFTLPRDRLRVVPLRESTIDCDALREGSEVAFIPPVSGG